jgi:UDP-3-O-[3-hydroxymyristoyl] glucosamine N-acyltransferase
MDQFAEEYEASWERQAISFQPWLRPSSFEEHEQEIIQDVLVRRCNARFGKDCYVAPEARIFAESLSLGHRSFVAAAAILRGNIKIGSDCSVNPYCHLAGTLKIGDCVRMAGHVSVYGFNHGFARAWISQSKISR